MIGVHLDGSALVELRDNVTILNRHGLIANDAVAVATPFLQGSTVPADELGCSVLQNWEKGTTTEHVCNSWKDDEEAALTEG